LNDLPIGHISFLTRMHGSILIFQARQDICSCDRMQGSAETWQSPVVNFRRLARDIAASHASTQKPGALYCSMKSLPGIQLIFTRPAHSIRARLPPT
jgi:hypothetical protein